uniref:Uncharacterized protein n=1 Tax=Rhizophora mucronata TaxID=61149 RepID=A0A2P2QC09_RHIMU
MSSIAVLSANCRSLRIFLRKHHGWAIEQRCYSPC